MSTLDETGRGSIRDCQYNSHPFARDLWLPVRHNEVDHASYAYNRAAVYLHGPDARLNPIKEGYTPPPPSGAPVRVPRNKVFALQLPPPLALKQVRRGRSHKEPIPCALRSIPQTKGSIRVALICCSQGTALQFVAELLSSWWPPQSEGSTVIGCSLALFVA